MTALVGYMVGQVPYILEFLVENAYGADWYLCRYRYQQGRY